MTLDTIECITNVDLIVLRHVIEKESVLLTALMLPVVIPKSYMLLNFPFDAQNWKKREQKMNQINCVGEDSQSHRSW